MENEISSAFFKISEKFQLPYGFISMKTHQSAQAALDLFKEKQGEFPFRQVDWALSKAERELHNEKNPDSRFIYLKNLKADVTNEMLAEVISSKFPVLSVRVSAPSVPSNKYDTKFATVVMQEKDKLSDLKAFAKENLSDFNKLFSRKVYVNRLHPKTYHKRHVYQQY